MNRFNIMIMMIILLIFLLFLLHYHSSIKCDRKYLFSSPSFHNFLVDYRESSNDPDKEVDEILERLIFELGLDDNNILPIVVGNQLSRGGGRPILHEVDCRTLGLQLRDKLKNDLQYYGLDRPRGKEWKDDSYSHVVRIE